MTAYAAILVAFLIVCGGITLAALPRIVGDWLDRVRGREGAP